MSLLAFWLLSDFTNLGMAYETMDYLPIPATFLLLRSLTFGVLLAFYLDPAEMLKPPEMLVRPNSDIIFLQLQHFLLY